MAESVNLGSAHVMFSGDFANVISGLRAVDQEGRRTSKSLQTEATRTERAVRGIGNSFLYGLRSWSIANKTMRRGLQDLTKTLVFIQLDIGHISDQFVRLSMASTAALGLMSASSLKFEKSFVQVRKVIDETSEGFDALEKNIRVMSTRIDQTADELAELMAVGGRLGVRGVEDLTKFTDTIAGLGVATNIIGEQGATELARFMNIMQESVGNVDRIGSAIVDLGNKFATTEAEILSMAQLIAGAGKTVGLTSDQVLGLATAMSQVGIEAERGGSAMSRVLIEIANAAAMGGNRLKTFSQVSGVNMRQFRRMVENDPIQAVTEFIGGLQRLDSEGKNVFKTLEDLGLNEIRTRDTLLRLMNAFELTSSAVQTSSRAFQENVALAEEVERAHEPILVQMSLLWNQVVEVARTIGDQLKPAWQGLIDQGRGLMKVFESLTDEQTALIAKWTALTAIVVTSIAGFLTALRVMFMLATVFPLVGRAILFAFSLPGAAIALITSLVISLARALNEEDWATIGKKITRFFDGVKISIQSLSSFLEGIGLKDLWEAEIGKLVEAWKDPELSLVDTVIESGKIIFELTVESFKILGGEAYDSFKALINGVLGREDESQPITLGDVLATMGILVSIAWNWVDQNILQSLANWLATNEKWMAFKQSTINLFDVDGSGDVNWLDVWAFLKISWDWLTAPITTFKEFISNEEQSGLENLLSELQKLWDSEFGDALKLLATVALSWRFRGLLFLVPLRQALSRMGIRSTGAGAWLYRMGFMTLYAFLVWELLPEDIQEKVQGLWISLADSIRDFNASTIESPFLDGVAGWIEAIGMDENLTGIASVVGLMLASKIAGGILRFGWRQVVTSAIGRQLMAGVLSLPLATIGIATGLIASVGVFAWGLSTGEIQKMVEESWNEHVAGHEFSVPLIPSAKITAGKIDPESFLPSDWNEFVVMMEEYWDKAKELGRDLAENFPSFFSSPLFSGEGPFAEAFGKWISEFNQKVEKAKKDFDEDVAGLGASFNAWFDGLLGIFNSKIQEWNTAFNEWLSWEKIKEAWNQFWESLFSGGDLYNDSLTQFFSVIETIIDTLQVKWDNFVKSLSIEFLGSNSIVSMFLDWWQGTFGRGTESSGLDTGLLTRNTPDRVGIGDTVPGDRLSRWQNPPRVLPHPAAFPKGPIPEMIMNMGHPEMISALLMLSTLEGSNLPQMNTGGPFQLRDIALRDLQSMGKGQGLVDLPGTQIVGGNLEALIQGGIDFAQIILTRFLMNKDKVEAQMEALGVSAAEAFSLAWVTGFQGFLNMIDLDQVITTVNGQSETGRMRLDRTRGLKFPISIPGFNDGTILPGFGGGDNILALLEAGEAVVPARVVSKGLGAIVEWFKGQGIPRFASGRNTLDVLSDATQDSKDVQVLAREIRELNEQIESLSLEELFEKTESFFNSLERNFLGALDLAISAVSALSPGAGEILTTFKDLVMSFTQSIGARERRDSGEGIDGQQETQESLMESMSLWQKFIFSFKEMFALNLEEVIEIFNRGKDFITNFGDRFESFLDSLLLGIQNFDLLGAISPIAGFFGMGRQRDAEGNDLGIENINRFKGAVDELIGSLSNAINPLSIFEEILGSLNPGMSFLSSLMSVLNTTIQVLMVPFKILGDAVGNALAPMVEELFPIFKELAIVATHLIEVFFQVISPVMMFGGIILEVAGEIVRVLGTVINPFANAVGTVVTAIGNTVIAIANLIPFGLGNGLKNLGVGIANAGKAVSAIGPTLLSVGQAGVQAGQAMQNAANSIPDMSGPMDGVRRVLRDLTWEAAQVHLMFETVGITLQNFMDSVNRVLGSVNLAQTFAEIERDVRMGIQDTFKNVIKQAIIQQFMEGVLKPQVDALLGGVKKAFLEGGDISFMAFTDLIKAIEDPAVELAKALKEAGFAGEELNKTFKEMVLNAPEGYRVARTRFEAALIQVPQMADGGIVMPTPGGTLVNVGEAGEPEVIRPLRDDIGRPSVIITGNNIYGPKDLVEYLRRAGVRVETEGDNILFYGSPERGTI